MAPSRCYRARPGRSGRFGLRKGVRMAVVVLVLWLFTAGAGFTLLVNSNLGRSRPQSASSPHLAAVTSAAAEAPAAAAEAPAAAAPAAVAGVPAAVADAPAAAQASAAHPVPEPRVSKRELRRAARDRFDPPSLTAAKNAP